MLMAGTAGAATERDLIAVLQSNAGVVEKCSACQQLRICGTAQSVAALAAVLGDERVGHAARYALEGMPYAEASAALREALGKTSGAIKAGLIDSLGRRRDTAATGAACSAALGCGRDDRRSGGFGAGLDRRRGRHHGVERGSEQPGS